MPGTVTAAVRTVVLVPLFFLYSLVLASMVVVYGWINPAAPIHNRLVNHWASVFLMLPPCRLHISGLENVDPSTRYIVASNHLSQFDIPLLFKVLPIDGRFLSKKEVFKVPIIGSAMRTIGIVEIDREGGAKSSREAINEGVKVAAERGYSFIVFPEGTRSTTSDLLPFKKGAFRIAIDTQLPLLPVVIEGTDRISRPGSKFFYGGDVYVRILPPIATAGMTNKDDLNPLIKTIEPDMQAVYAEMRSVGSNTG
ncbi:MAG: lysophospholipid acyltransferase family protein [Acidimicrobiia bacterium]